MQGLGEALRSEREKRGISLEQIATDTNINLKCLEALEREDSGKIPGVFYFKIYIKSYLEAVGADPDEFFKAHKEDMDAVYRKKETSVGTYCSNLKYSRFKEKNIYISILIAALFFVVIFYFLYSKRAEIFGNLNEKTPETFSAYSVPESGIDFAALRANDDFNRDYAPVRVAIEFVDRCWIQVLKGKVKIIEQTYKNGDTLTLNGYNIEIYMGNPAALRFNLNGKELKYLQTQATALRLILTPATVAEILKK